MNYQNLGLYDKVYSGRRDFEEPYRMFSGAVQFRYTPDERVVWKVYAQYDRTDFSTYEGDNRRLFGLGEDNIYVNATFRRHTSGEWSWFAGAAYSYYNRRIGGAVVSGDNWLERQQETHLKAKFQTVVIGIPPGYGDRELYPQLQESLSVVRDG